LIEAFLDVPHSAFNLHLFETGTSHFPKFMFTHLLKVDILTRKLLLK
jgi:hypothetical protein